MQRETSSAISNRFMTMAKLSSVVPGSIEAPAGFEWGQERGVPVFELLLAPCSSMERTTSVCPPSIRSANSRQMRRSIDQILALDRVKGLSLASQPAVCPKSRAPERVAVSDMILIYRGGRVFDTGCS